MYHLFLLVIIFSPGLASTDSSLLKTKINLDSTTYERLLTDMQQKMVLMKYASPEIAKIIDKMANFVPVDQRCRETSENVQSSDSQQQQQYSSQSWSQIEVSDSVLGALDYDNYEILLYEHARNFQDIPGNQKIFFFAPIVQLNQMSAISYYNKLTRKSEMSFNVLMWNEALKIAVQKFISSNLNRPVNMFQIRILPFDTISLFSMQVMEGIELSTYDVVYQGNQFLRFKYSCDQLSDCEALAAAMKLDPSRFDLKMRFTLATQLRRTDLTNIDITNIMSGEMMNNLDQKFRGKEVLLTAEDKNKLLKETSTNIIIQMVSDSDIPTATSEENVYGILERLLQFSRTIIQRGESIAWESVFWNEDNYRPDKTSNTFNEIYSKLETDTKRALQEFFNNTNQFAIEGGIGVKEVKLEGKYKRDISAAGSMSLENVEKLLRESANKIQWSGTKFTPKEMELSRLNMVRLSDRQTFQDIRVNVEYRTSMLTMNVREKSLSGEIHPYWTGIINSIKNNILGKIKIVFIPIAS